MAKYKLSDVETIEVSLVPKGANDKKFFLLKTADGDHVVSAMDLISKLIDEVVEKGGPGSGPRGGGGSSSSKELGAVEDHIAELQTQMDNSEDPQEKEHLNAQISDLYAKHKQLRMRTKQTKSDFNELCKKLDAIQIGSGETVGQLIEVLQENFTGEQIKQILLRKLGVKEGETRMSEKSKETPDLKDGVLKGDLEAVSKEHRETIEKMQTENAELKKALEESNKKQEELAKEFVAQKDAVLTKEFIEVAKGFKHIAVTAEEFGPVLKSIHNMDKAAYEKVMAVLKAADTALGETELFKSAGSEARGKVGSAWTKIEALAKQVVEKSGGKISLAQATTDVLLTDEGKKLYNEDLAEVTGGAI